MELIKDLLTSQAFSVIASAAITTLGLIVVQYLANRRGKKSVAKKMADFDDAKGWLDYFDKKVELVKEECNKKLEAMQKELDQARILMEDEQTKRKRYEDKLLWLRRTQGIDVSDVIQ